MTGPPEPGAPKPANVFDAWQYLQRVLFVDLMGRLYATKLMRQAIGRLFR